MLAGDRQHVHGDLHVCLPAVPWPGDPGPCEIDKSAPAIVEARLIAELTERDDLRIHASMGGRLNTVSFLLARCRPQDG
jgi:hypothetical protein